jgi:hypothetical protein
LKSKGVPFALILLLLYILSACPAISKDSKSGTSSLSFLKLGAGARALGMGEAFCAQDDGVVSPFWNPAAPSRIQGTRLSFTHTQWFQDITADFFSSATKVGENIFGLSLSVGRISDIEKRDTPTSEPLAFFDAHDAIASFSYARVLNNKFSLGASVKWIYEKIDISSASSLGFDLGGMFSLFAETGKPILQDITFGLAILNLGSKIKFEKESYHLPTQYKAGMSYSVRRHDLKSDFTLNLDVVKPRDDDTKVHLGGEYGLYQSFKLRLGYQLGYDEKDLSFGMGINYRNYSIDYAFLPYESDLGDVHCISLDVGF